MPKRTEIARRCSMCAVNWPDLPEYSKCPECGDTADRVKELTPISEDEARSRKRHAEFETFYEQWDETHDPARLVSND